MFSVLTNMVIMYVDIVLLMILLCLILCVCAYCAVRIRRLQQTGHVTVLLRPTRVMFSHKNEDNGKEELRTVVAYQNPFTGDYCMHKNRPPKGYLNALESPDSGLSDEYEPLKPVGRREGDYGPFNIQEHGTLHTVARGNRAFQSMGDVTRVQDVGDGDRAFQSTGDGDRAFQSVCYGERTFQSTGDVDRAFQSTGDGDRAFLSVGYGERTFQSTGDVDRAFQSTGDGDRAFQRVGYGERTFQSTGDVNSVNKTWNWNYKEYQI